MQDLFHQSEGMLLEILLLCFGLLSMTARSINLKIHHKQIESWVQHMHIILTFNFRQLPAITNLNSIHVARWPRGMILTLGARGPRFESQTSPMTFS